jgi:hypothetical protein
MLSLNRKLFYSPTEKDLDIFERLDIKIKYNITYMGDKTYDWTNYKVKYVLFSTDEGSYPHRHLILQFEGGEFGYMQFWYDCLPDSDIEITNNLDNVIQYCLTDKVRTFYFKFIDNINNIYTKLSKYLIKDLINIAIEFMLKNNPI